jgi:hypothetical protein
MTESKDHVEPRFSPTQQRYVNNLFKIILALLKSEFAPSKSQLSRLAKDLAVILQDLAHNQADETLKVSEQTILKRLSEALELIR